MYSFCLCLFFPFCLFCQFVCLSMRRFLSFTLFLSIPQCVRTEILTIYANLRLDGANVKQIQKICCITVGKSVVGVQVSFTGACLSEFLPIYLPAYLPVYLSISHKTARVVKSCPPCTLFQLIANRQQHNFTIVS